jgi:hypothetical protein
MRNDGINLNTLFKLAVIFGVLLVSVSISYYYIGFLPMEERAKNDMLRKQFLQEQARENALKQNELYLNECLDEQYERYSNILGASCKNIGKPEGCELPPSITTTIERTHKEGEEGCYQRYQPKQNSSVNPNLLSDADPLHAK